MDPEMVGTVDDMDPDAAADDLFLAIADQWDAGDEYTALCALGELLRDYGA